MAFLKEQYNLELFGVEPSQTMKENCKTRHSDLNVHEGDANHIPFPDSFFDGVLIECVFSIIEDKKSALDEIKRVLKPNGRLIMSDVYLREKSQDIRPSIGCGCFMGAMFKQEIYDLLNQNNFQIDLWQDHSSYFKDIAIKIIMDGGSLLEFQKALGLKAEDDNDTRLISKPGYFLIVSKNIK